MADDKPLWQRALNKILGTEPAPAPKAKTPGFGGPESEFPMMPLMTKQGKWEAVREMLYGTFRPKDVQDELEAGHNIAVPLRSGEFYPNPMNINVPGGFSDPREGAVFPRTYTDPAIHTSPLLSPEEQQRKEVEYLKGLYRTKVKLGEIDAREYPFDDYLDDTLAEKKQSGWRRVPVPPKTK